LEVGTAGSRVVATLPKVARKGFDVRGTSVAGNWTDSKWRLLAQMAVKAARRTHMEEKHFGALVSDTVISEQFFATFRSTHLEPEKALLLAILEDAVHCLEKYKAAKDRAGRERFRDAENWIMEPGNEWIFSFDNVCELLGLDPQYVRQRLQKQRAKTLELETRRRRHGSRRQAA
jgi:hypothetical protein